MVPGDAELVKRARNNHMSSYQQLVERYKKKIYFTSLSILGNHHDAEDVLQETLLQALRSLDRLRYPEGFGAWIVRIAYNRSIDTLRKRKRELDPKKDENGLDLFDLMESDTPAGNPDRVIESSEISHVITSTLSKLPGSQKNAFTLKHIAQLSIKEIAVAMNSTESTVKTNIYRAVQKLRCELAPFVKSKDEISGVINTGTVS